MNFIIKSIHLENFKGCREATYVFDGKNASVLGQNGAGKTTIATAFYWLFTDKDYDLHSNPAIRPIGVEECTPRVEVVLDIDGREVTAAKFQKCTKKKDGAISLSNSYEVNCVEYGERDFKAKMGEYGVNFDLLLPLSHSDVFTGQKSNDMRKVLFSMASEKSDKEIADMTEGAGDVAEMLINYTMEEIKAMQNSTLRKIKEDYGKDGEILRAKIEGLEMSKSNVDVAELELGKKAINELIKSNKANQDDMSKRLEEYNKLSDKVMELKFAENDLQRKANEELVKQKKDIQAQINEKNEYLFNISEGIQRNNRDIANCEHEISEYEAEITKVREEWKALNAMRFDETEEVCQLCGQRLPQDKIDTLRAEFESRKKKSVEKITDRGNELKSLIDANKEHISRQKECNKINNENYAKFEEEVAELQAQLVQLPNSVDISDTDEFKAIRLQIAECEEAMAKCNSITEFRQSLKEDEARFQSQLTEIEKRIAVASENIIIDEKISELKTKQAEYEQSKADCEKILYQLDLVSRKKNELLTEDINKHFEAVKWDMFEELKNKEIRDCCIPKIDGKRFGESTNTGKEVLAKLDIIKGLQKFYGQFYPVFLDGAECLTSVTKERVDMDCQLIYLVVAESELRIEVE